MTLGILIQWGKHNREDGLDVVTDEIAEVLVVPEVQSTLSDLEQLVGWRSQVRGYIPGSEGWQQTLPTG